MSPLKVSYSNLEEAFQVADDQARHYWLDRQTGEVISYSSEAAEAIEDGDLADLPEWMTEEVEAARAVLSAFWKLPGQEVVDQEAEGGITAEPDRYVAIERIPSQEAFQFMEDFVGDLPDSTVRERLVRALRGNGPFRRFRNALQDFPIERDRWFEYESRRRREYIEEWAREKGLELDFTSE